MKFIISTSIFITILLLNCCQAPKQVAGLTKLAQIKAIYQKDIDSLANLLNSKLLVLAEKSNSTDSLQKIFFESRKAYKKIEHFTEYFMPTTSRFLNGAPLDEIEAEENKSFEAGGLQVIEEFLFPEFDTTQRLELIRHIKKAKLEVERAKVIWQVSEPSDQHVFDALKLQIFRIITLGISGFDTPLSKNAMQEASVSLSSIKTYLTLFQTNTETYNKLWHKIDQAEKYLLKYPDFDSFNRMYFITKFANPISSQLVDYQNSIGIKPFEEVRALRANAKTLFDENVFDPNFYAPTQSAYATPSKVELGRSLFYDNILSENNQRNCASCHQPEKAFTDGLPKSVSFSGKGFISRNAPTIINAGLQQGLFYDQRAVNLENQAVDVIQNKDEMHGSMEKIAGKLQSQVSYLQRFQQSFPNLEKIKSEHIQNALASYVRSLTFMDSRFDKYVRGEKSQLNSQEINGFNLFMGKAKCGTCHFMPLFNGTVPPNFIKTESEVIGVPADKSGKSIDPDIGKYAQVKVETMKYAFKTTTVRNISLTAPYMHNGVYETLEEVVDFYNKGGGKGLGIDLPHQTLPFDKLSLTEQEQADLVAFMKALSDISLLKNPQ